METSRIPFRVHKNTSCDQIEFFNRLFRGLFKESIVELPEGTPEDLELMLEWCYRWRLPRRGRLSREFRKDACLKRIQLFCFADWSMAYLSWWTNPLTSFLKFWRREPRDLRLQCARMSTRTHHQPRYCWFYSRVTVTFLRILEALVNGRFSCTAFPFEASQNLIHDLYTHLRTLPVMMAGFSRCTYPEWRRPTSLQTKQRKRFIIRWFPISRHFTTPVARDIIHLATIGRAYVGRNLLRWGYYVRTVRADQLPPILGNNLGQHMQEMGKEMRNGVELIGFGLSLKPGRRWC